VSRRAYEYTIRSAVRRTHDWPDSDHAGGIGRSGLPYRLARSRDHIDAINFDSRLPATIDIKRTPVRADAGHVIGRAGAGHRPARTLFDIKHPNVAIAERAAKLPPPGVTPGLKKSKKKPSGVRIRGDPPSTFIT
jgi:hypothetical protein